MEQVKSRRTIKLKKSFIPLWKRSRTRDERLLDVNWSKLTPRMKEVADLLGRGLEIHEIAARLGLEVGTVYNYSYMIGDRLNLKGIEEVRTAARNSIIR